MSKQNRYDMYTELQMKNLKRWKQQVYLFEEENTSVKYACLSQRETGYKTRKKKSPKCPFSYLRLKFTLGHFWNFTFISFTNKFYCLMLEIQWVVLLKKNKLNSPCCFDFFFFFFFFFCFGLWSFSFFSFFSFSFSFFLPEIKMKQFKTA